MACELVATGLADLKEFPPHAKPALHRRQLQGTYLLDRSHSCRGEG
jgi:hypothetical protein